MADCCEERSRLETWWDNHWLPAIGLVLIGFALVVWAHYAHFSPGKSIGALATVAGIMSLRPKMSFPEKLAWILILIALTVFEFHAIDDADTQSNATKKQLNEKLDGIKNAIELDTRQLNVVSQGIAAMAQNPPSRPTHTVTTPPQPQTGKRFVSAEQLGLDLQGKESSSATVINDGTNEAGNFANQLVIGLRDANWVAGGNNIKMGDPEFFPDALTVEVSSRPATSDDHSVTEAKALVAALQKQHITATLRYTDQAFPANFMRIKVAGQ